MRRPTSRAKPRHRPTPLEPAAKPPARAAAGLLPLGALAAGFGFAGLATAQSGAPAAPPAAVAPAEPDAALPVVRTRAQADSSGKDSLRATTTNIGRGTQQLRDIPQSITVVTERLIDDRNLDTVRDVLRNTAGVTFQAAEGAEEDIRLRGFSLQGTGDIFIDGMRDPAFYDRDTFNNDRIELLRGSASMLFGRGSTGGAVNQVTKAPRLLNQNEVTATVGNFNYRRLTGDFNLVTGENAAVRLNVMRTTADNNGSGSSIDKSGLAGAFRWGIGTRDEFQVSAYWLDNENGINYGIPWIRPTAASSSAENTIIPGLKPQAYYGMASDRNHGGARMVTLSHIHRFSGTTELRTQVRKGEFKRDLRASAIRFAGAAQQPGAAAIGLNNFGPNTVFTRGSNYKIQDVDTLHVQSDLSTAFDALGVRHELLAGVDFTREAKDVYIPRTAAQGGVNLTKPTTTAGTPGDGAWVDEDSRILRDNNAFVAKGYGAFVQDVVQVAPAWKVIGGLRYDNLDGSYNVFNIPTNAAGPVTTVPYQQRISAVSKRLGVLYQPTPLQSFHFSWGTSFNTSGDTYSYNTQNANTPPEESQNIELGARLDTEDRRFTTRFALFRTTKTNERNTDVDTAADRLLLSGKRHATGIEADVTGRLTPKWEVFGSYMWLFDAKVDAAAPCPAAVPPATTPPTCLQATVGNRVGDRPGLSPKHSGTVWSTYQVLPRLRLGAGVNFRSKQAPADVTAPAWTAPGFATLDLMAEYRVSDNVSVKANVINVGDKYYADALYRGHYVPGAGRLVQASLIGRF
ncbi:TonB-dependent receptor [Aquabacterium sp. J223]|uniref:TonB-dependent receptor n=1 Tax=Aquabacterium sp. J223 TaxID=2898431 RepID=UPI0021ADC03E|nr:TonB-dependent receptor [Aquabacterium sp. J223]UUX96060.1 TonB-dependent receptor [Aquabacterium sp. J223]